ncbi:MAG: caspase family protein [Balneolales bacterium]
MKSIPLLFLLVLAWLLAGCSTTLWIMQNEPEIDRSDGQIVSSDYIVMLSEMPTRENPVLALELYDRNEYEYSKRHVTKRYVQQYRPRYTYLFLGLGTAAMAFYLANSQSIENESLSREGKITLNVAGGITTLASLLNMKPIGSPMDAGERKYLGDAGTATVVDTIRSTTAASVEVTISAWHNNDLLIADIPATFDRGMLELNLIDKLNITGFDESEAGFIQLNVNVDNQDYAFNIDVESIMEEFVIVTSQNTPLRSQPADNETNIITNIGIESQFPLVETIENDWFRVLYGISPVYVSTMDAEVVWRPGNLNVDELVLAPGDSVFGEIDIERSIPDTDVSNPDGIALLIGNGNYQEPLNRIPNTDRSLQLLRRYLINTLGYSPDNVIVMQEASENDILSILDQSDNSKFMNRPIKPDTTDLFVYYVGQAVADRRNDADAYLLPSDYDFSNPSQKLINAQRFLSTIGQIKTRSTTILFETDFLLLGANGQPQFSQNQRQGILLRELSSVVTSQNPNSALFFAANRNQQAGQYISNDGRLDNKHGIFTYYFINALKEGQLTTGRIFNSMQHNITFTSRRLHDRAQDPQMFGNSNISLIKDN